MQAFHNDPKIKDFYLTRLKMHRAADELIHGIYWENGKGCAIGCTLHSDKHEDFETVLGLPEWFAFLFEFLFEKQKNSKAKDFPIQALEAIHIGADLQKTYHKFCVFLLEEIIQFDKEKFPQVKKAIDDIIQLHRRVIDKAVVQEEERSAAQAAAWSAKESVAWSAKESVAWSAAIEKIADKLIELLKEAQPVA